MHGLRHDPLADVQEDPVLGDKPPDHGATEGDEAEDTRSEAEEVPDCVTPGEHDDGYEQQSHSRRHAVGGAARPGEGAGATWRVHGCNSESSGRRSRCRTLGGSKPGGTRFELLRCYQRATGWL